MNKKNIVVKIGTSTLLKNNKIDTSIIKNLVKIIKQYSKIYNFIYLSK